jgi:hemerythrin-like domain-containing protein
MTPTALTIIRDEHQAIAAVLHALTHLVRRIREEGAPPDFQALRALIFYIDAYPERLHHPKESRHLFRCLRARSADAEAILDRLDEEHARGEGETLRIEHLLLEYEMLGPTRFAAFDAGLSSFAAAYLQHMRTEEEQVLPLAARVLTPEDWAGIDAAFAANRDPLTGHPPEQEFAALFRRIVGLLPPPLGVGPARAAPP